MVTGRSRILAPLLALIAFETACLLGLWFISSAGVEEGMAFGAGRFFALFVGMKALAACLLPDGAVLEGYRPRDFLEEWLGEVR